MRILIADRDGGYRARARSQCSTEFVQDLKLRVGARDTVRVQWPHPGEGGHARPHSWESAAAAGVADLARLVRLHPSDDIVLIGVGCGTRVIHDWIDANPDLLDRVAAVGLIGDPFRPRGQTLPGVPDPGGQGVYGSWESPIPERTFWLSVPGDPLSGVDGDSPLRPAVHDSDLAPDQAYDELLVDLPESRTGLAARLGVAHRPTQWSPGLPGRVDRAREVLRRQASGHYIEAYETGEQGQPSPLGQLIMAIAEHTAESNSCPAVDHPGERLVGSLGDRSARHPAGHSAGGPVGHSAGRPGGHPARHAHALEPGAA